MPHIVFDQKINLDDFSKKFIPVFQKEPFLIKVSSIFVEQKNSTALLPALVISELRQQYFIEIFTNESKTTIRLYPGTDPKKTEGVKKSMALVAKQIMKIYPNFHLIQTNLSEYLGVEIKI